MAFFVSNLWTNSLLIAQACPWSARAQSRDRGETLPPRSFRVDSVVSRAAAPVLPDSGRGNCVRQRRCAVWEHAQSQSGPKFGAARHVCSRGGAPAARASEWEGLHVMPARGDVEEGTESDAHFVHEGQVQRRHGQPGAETATQQLGHVLLWLLLCPACCGSACCSPCPRSSIFTRVTLNLKPWGQIRLPQAWRARASQATPEARERGAHGRGAGG